MSEPARVFLTLEEYRALIDELKHGDNAFFLVDEEEEDEWETSDIEFIDFSDDAIDDDADFEEEEEPVSEEDTD
jgi:hypothetical protein